MRIPQSAFGLLLSVGMFACAQEVFGQGCMGNVMTFTNSVVAGDFNRGARLSLDGVVSSCASPKTCPSAVTGVFRFDNYQLLNLSTNTVCYTVMLNNTLGCGAGLVSEAYSPSLFVGPGTACTNYLADIGSAVAPGNTASYSFQVPASTTFNIVVLNADSAAVCSGGYSLSITPCPALFVACAPLTGTVTGGGAICPGGSNTVTVTVSGGGAPPYTVALDNGGGLQTGTGGQEVFNFIVGPSSATIYSLDPGGSHDNNNCPISGSSSATVTVSANPDPPILAANPSPVCPNSTGNTATGPASSGYAWTIAGGTLTSPSDLQTISYSAGSGSSVTLGLTTTDANGCVAQNSLVVPIRTVLPPTIAPSASMVCPNSTDIQASGPSGAAAYAWEISNGVITGASDTETVTFNAGFSGSVGLTLRVSDASGCFSTASVNVPIGDTTPPTAFCPADVIVTVCGTSGRTAVNFDVSGSDNCSLATVVANPPSGSLFPVGTNTVTVTATDAAGNQDTCTFRVIVGPPTLVATDFKANSDFRLTGDLFVGLGLDVLRHETDESGYLTRYHRAPPEPMTAFEDQYSYNSRWGNGAFTCRTELQRNSEGNLIGINGHATAETIGCRSYADAGDPDHPGYGFTFLLYTAAFSYSEVYFHASGPFNLNAALNLNGAFDNYGGELHPPEGRSIQVQVGAPNLGLPTQLPAGDYRLYISVYADSQEERVFYRSEDITNASGVADWSISLTPQSTCICNVRASQIPGTKLVDIYYDLSGTDGNPREISADVATNAPTLDQFDGHVNTASDDIGVVYPGNNRHIIWNAGADLGAVPFSGDIRIRVRAVGGCEGISDPFRLDLGNNPELKFPIVIDVWGMAGIGQATYCQGDDRSGKHVYFLKGVSLNVPFVVQADWNGAPRGEIQFISPLGTITKPYSDPQSTYDVGSDFGLTSPAAYDSNHLFVKLVAADGTESLPFKVNFDVIDPPPPLPQSPLLLSLLLTPNPNFGMLFYSTREFLIPFMNSESDPVPDNIPILRGQRWRFVTGLRASAKIYGDGTGSGKGSVSIPGVGGRSGFGIGDLFRVDPRVMFKANWRYFPDCCPNERGWRTGGQVGFEINGKIRSPILPLVTPFVFLRGEFEVNDTGLFGVTGWDTNQNFAPIYQGAYEGKIKYTGFLGTGLASPAEVYAAVEGYLAIGVPFTIQTPPMELKKLGFQVDLGVQANLMGLSFDLPFITPKHFECWLIGTPPCPPTVPAAIVTALNNPGSAKWTLLPRDYQKRPYADFAGGQLKKGANPPSAALSAEKGLGEISSDVMQNNVFPYSQPSLSVSGTNRMLVWVWDDPNRAPENRTELVWSMWSGTNWLNPTPISNDGTADFSPVVRLFPDGSALAVWQNEKSVLTNGLTLEIALAGAEITAARFDPLTATWMSTNLTSNSHLDHSPHLSAATNGTAMLAWIANASDNILGATNALNRIESRLWDGNIWRMLPPISTNAPTLLWSSVAFDGTNGVFLATIDSDFDAVTPEDQEVWGATFDGNAWSPFVPLTANAVPDTKPQAVYDSTGQLFVVWHQGSNLVTRIGNLELQSATTVGEVGGASSARDFSLISGAAGEISLVWEDIPEGGGGPDPICLNYDTSLGVWSLPLRLLDNTNQLERSFSGAYGTNGQLFLAFNRVTVSVDTNNIPLFGQTDLMLLEYQMGYDLSVGDINLSTNNPVPGDLVTISAIIRNTGELALTNVQAAFFDGNPANGGVLIGSTQTVAGVLVAGSNAVLQVTWVIPPSSTNRLIHVVATSAQTQMERNQSNNRSIQPVLAADLTDDGTSVVQSSTSTRIINVGCRNIGAITAGKATRAEFRRGAADGPLLASVPIGDLGTNGFHTASFQWDLKGLSFTNSFELVYVKLDADNLIAESDEENNTVIVSVLTTLDSDGDGLLDGTEPGYGTDPLKADSDGDGLSDAAEIRIHGTNPLILDTDGDGMTDGQEILAGTNPRSAASVFRISSVARNPEGSITLQWQSATNKQYRVNRSLTPLRNNYSTLTNGMPGTPPLNSFTDTSATNAAAFYWVELQ